MSKQFRALQRRFGSDRPGLQLIAVEDAAVPVTVIRADTLAQERKELPITEEFALRFIKEGVDQPSEIAGYLGLDTGQVLEAVAEQLGEGHIRRASSERLALNPAGEEVVTTLAATRPVLRQLPVSFDRLTWKLADYPERSLIQKKDAEERGMTILPAARNARIGQDDVTPAEFNRLLKIRSKERLQVLRIHKVTLKRHLYFPVQLLVYGDESRSEIELAICIDDALAHDHGIALDRIGAVDRLGLKLAVAEPRPILDEELESQRSGPIEPSPAVPTDSPEPPLASASGFTGLVESVSVFEHADLLTDALESAKKRLLIISPWINRAVVNTDFMAKLERRLRSGVQVTIAYGFGADEKSDPAAVRRLQNLAGRFNGFDFARVANTHAKILIFDDCWVSTSFNWLSFRGDPDRTYRMEEGTLVRIPKKVDEAYQRYLGLIDEQRTS